MTKIKNTIITIFHWLFYFILYWIVILTTYALSPVLPLFRTGEDVLPKWLTWFQTPNADLNGDRGYQERYLWAKSKYLRQILWLIRNPAGGYCWNPAGKFIDKGTKVYFKGTQNVSERKNGWQFIYTEDFKCLQFRLYTKPYKGKLLKLRLGWKMRYLANSGEATGDLVKFCWTFNPFRSEQK